MVKCLVLDEMVRMLDLDFMPNMKKIMGEPPEMLFEGERVTLMFSAAPSSPFPPHQFLYRYIFLTSE